MNLQEYLLIKQAASEKDEVTTLDNLRLKFLQGEALGRGYNGPKNIKVDDEGNVTYKHTNKSRLRQGGALALSGLGAAGGAFGGYKLTKLLSDKLGLDKEDEKDSKLKKTLKALAKAGLITAGTVGGGIGGYMLGTTGAGYMNGLKNNDWDNFRTAVSAVAARPENRGELKKELSKYMKEKGITGRKKRTQTNATLDWMLPVEPY